MLLRAFVQVAAQIPAVRLLLVGAGPEHDALQQLSQSLGLSGKVTWLGHLNPNALEQQLAGTWAQVVPSLWSEPFGRTAAEAHIRGTAVVASNCGGLPEIVLDGENGFLVPPNNEKAFADALLRLLHDPELAEKMGQRGRARAGELRRSDLCA